MMDTIGFLGCGNMGGAIARAVCKAVDPKKVFLANRTAAKAQALAKELGCKTATNAEVAGDCDLIFLAVKPQMMEALLQPLKFTFDERPSRFVLCSMAAGLSIARIQELAGEDFPVIRIMPNTPASVGEGMIQYCSSNVTAEEEEAFLIGDGRNKPTGVFPSAELGVTANGASITFDDVIDLYHSLRIPYRRKAVWLLNDATIKTLRKIKDNNGNYIWQPSVTAGTPDTILNRPCYCTSFAPELAAGNHPMLFGDFSYYWIADREYRSFKRLNELYAANGQIGFLASQRVDGMLMLKEAVKALEMKAKG